MLYYTVYDMLSLALSLTAMTMSSPLILTKVIFMDFLYDIPVKTRIKWLSGGISGVSIDRTSLTDEPNRRVFAYTGLLHIDLGQISMIYNIHTYEIAC